MKKNIEKNRKNAFTLIELISIIVILGIIALIAVPTMKGIMDESRKKAFMNTAYGIIKAGEIYYSKKDMLGEEIIEETFDFPNNVAKLKINGQLPKSGEMRINEDGDIALAITDDDYCITKGFKDADITLSEDLDNCRIITPGSLLDLATTANFTRVDGTNPTEISAVHTCTLKGSQCEPGTAFAIEVAPDVIYKFYVLKDDIIKNEITLIMDRNLYSETDENYGNVVWINAGDYGSTPVYNNQGPLTALKILKERTSGWTNIPAYTYTLENDADGKGGTNSYASISKPLTTTPNSAESVVENVRARLPKISELKVENVCHDNGCSSWLYENLENTGDINTKGYWTSTVYSKDTAKYAWDVSQGGWLHNAGVVYDDATYGIRPVITLAKS